MKGEAHASQAVDGKRLVSTGGDQEQEGGWGAAAMRVCLCHLQD